MDDGKMSPTKRYVAVADVLGFTALVGKTDLGDLARRYADLVTNANVALRMHVRATSFAAATGKHRAEQFTLDCEHVVFSDTVLLWSDPIDTGGDGRDFDGRLFFHTLANLFSYAFTSGFPLRIGVAFGECVVNTSAQVFVGEAIVSAYHTEQAQDWLGVACHPSCERAPWAKNLTMVRAVDRIPAGPLLPCAVPTKPQSALHDVLRWSIDWPTILTSQRPELVAEVDKHRGTPHEARWTRALDFYDKRQAEIWGSWYDSKAGGPPHEPLQPASPTET